MQYIICLLLKKTWKIISFGGLPGLREIIKKKFLTDKKSRNSFGNSINYIILTIVSELKCLRFGNKDKIHLEFDFWELKPISEIFFFKFSKPEAIVFLRKTLVFTTNLNILWLQQIQVSK